MIINNNQNKEIMSKFKGTKGEWKLERELNSRIDLVDIVCEKRVIAKMSAYEFYGNSISQSNYNAKLIACAPEMLEMLDLLTTVYSADNIEKAKRLIKKATE